MQGSRIEFPVKLPLFPYKIGLWDLLKTAIDVCFFGAKEVAVAKIDPTTFSAPRYRLPLLLIGGGSPESGHESQYLPLQREVGPQTLFRNQEQTPAALQAVGHLQQLFEAESTDWLKTFEGRLPEKFDGGSVFLRLDYDLTVPRCLILSFEFVSEPSENIEQT